MFYNAPARGDDGLYFVKACNDEKRKCLVQLNGVTVSEVSGEMIFDLNSEVNTKKVTDIENMRALDRPAFLAAFTATASTLWNLCGFVCLPGSTPSSALA